MEHLRPKERRDVHNVHHARYKLSLQSSEETDGKKSVL